MTYSLCLSIFTFLLTLIKHTLRFMNYSLYWAILIFLIQNTGKML